MLEQDTPPHKNIFPLSVCRTSGPYLTSKRPFGIFWRYKTRVRHSVLFLYQPLLSPAYLAIFLMKTVQCSIVLHVQKCCPFYDVWLKSVNIYIAVKGK